MKACGDLVMIPSRRTAVESIQRMEDLGLEAAPPITAQHVISKVVMKRFASPAGRDGSQVCYISLYHPDRAYLRGPAGCGKVDDYLTFASGFLEKLWKKTEDKMHDALLAVDAGTVLSSDRHSATIKDTIALHFARSLATRQVSEQLWQQVVLQERTRWLRTPAGRKELQRLFRGRHGLDAAGPAALEMMLDEILASSMAMWQSGAKFAEGLEYMHDHAQAWLRTRQLEILTPGRGEFLIGDVPALTIQHGNPRVGVLGGIALHDASSVFMPLGPRHVAGLGRVPQTAELSSDQVNEVNAAQLLGAMERIYMRPGSGLEDFARKMIASRLPASRAAGQVRAGK
jgi:hypothetical protein